jgi:peptidylamidoglycolate lyase
MTTSLSSLINKLSLPVGLIIFFALSNVVFGDEMKYQVVHGWPQLPENSILDEVSAVAVDSQSNIYVLQRGGRKWPDNDILDKTLIEVPTIYIFDGRTGSFLKKWGDKLFAWPHGLTIDDKDNIWVTDVSLHQVFKFSHDGKLLLTLGESGVAGNDPSHFNRPTDVAVAKDGSFYVSDGYGNSRVLKFSADGKLLFEWGKKGKGPGEFDLPHAIALDTNGNVYVVDRQNARIQVFDDKGKYITEWKGFIMPQNIKIGEDGTAFIVDPGNDQLPDRSGLLIMNKDGSLIERVGRYGNYDGQFLDPHWVAIGKSGEVYVADFTGKRVQKFVRNKN